MKEKKWKRNCPNPDRNPNCKRELTYSTKYTKIRAEKRNTNCKSCVKFGEKNPMYGKKRSEKARQRMSKSKMGENKPNYGKERSEETKKNISK